MASSELKGEMALWLLQRGPTGSRWFITERWRSRVLLSSLPCKELQQLAPPASRPLNPLRIQQLFWLHQGRLETSPELERERQMPVIITGAETTIGMSVG